MGGGGGGAKTLSSAGKEVLIKAVLQSIPTYIMSCFLLTGYLIKKVESAIRAFWWGSGESRNLCGSLGRLCAGRRNRGLGFRDLHAFNIALLAKQDWRLLLYPDSLMARVFQARYYPHGSILGANLGTRPSATWSSIFKARSLLVQGLRICIGNGYSTEIWSRTWIPDDVHFSLFTPRPPDTFFSHKVADLIIPKTHTWNAQLIEETFWPIDSSRILSIPLGAVTSNDRLIWQYAKYGRF